MGGRLAACREVFTMARLFGTDGVRGLANGDVLTPELAMAVARSAAHELLALRQGPGRPLAVTDDMASFWAGPYQGVRADMRGRYPKHPWPEDPWSATATARTKKGRS